MRIGISFQIARFPAKHLDCLIIWQFRTYELVLEGTPNELVEETLGEGAGVSVSGRSSENKTMNTVPSLVGN